MLYFKIVLLLKEVKSFRIIVKLATIALKCVMQLVKNGNLVNNEVNIRDIKLQKLKWNFYYYSIIYYN